MVCAECFIQLRPVAEDEAKLSNDGEKDRILRALDKEIGDDPIRDKDTRGRETKDARLVSQLPSFEMRAGFVKERFECLSSKELLIFL